METVCLTCKHNGRDVQRLLGDVEMKGLEGTRK